jgi:hypothetical protein
MSRPKLFEIAEFGLDQFAPKEDQGPTVPVETVRMIASEGGFPSRAPQPNSNRLPMVYRTGRSATFSVKTLPTTVETFYEIARARGWKAGETFEKAIEALKRELS